MKFIVQIGYLAHHLTRYQGLSIVVGLTVDGNVLILDVTLKKVIDYS